MSKRNNYGSCFETCPTGLLGGAGGLNRYRVLIQGLGLRVRGKESRFTMRRMDVIRWLIGVVKLLAKSR